MVTVISGNNKVTKKLIVRQTLFKSLILNCGYGKPYSVLDIANIFKIKKKNTQIRFKKRRPGDIAEVYSNTKKINKILKLKVKYDNLENILDSAYKWEKKINSI